MANNLELGFARSHIKSTSPLSAGTANVYYERIERPVSGPSKDRIGYFAVNQTRTRGTMDGELRVHARCKHHGVDQDSAWQRAVGAVCRYEDRSISSDAGDGRKFLPAARIVGVPHYTRRYVS